MPDLETENLLKKLRQALLLNEFSEEKLELLKAFQSALALQCFVNEYIYEETNEETRIIERLETAIPELIKNGDKEYIYKIVRLSLVPSTA